MNRTFASTRRAVVTLLGTRDRGYLQHCHDRMGPVADRRPVAEIAVWCLHHVRDQSLSKPERVLVKFAYEHLMVPYRPIPQWGGKPLWIIVGLWLTHTGNRAAPIVADVSPSSGFPVNTA